MEGNKEALYRIAPYLDVNDTIFENLGYHIFYPKVKNIAKRILSENTLFLRSEFALDSTVTTSSFLDFLKTYNSQITFDGCAQAFLITPLEKRTVKTILRTISAQTMRELQERKNELLKPEWVHLNEIDSLITHRNSKALLAIASELHKQRNRYNRYNFQKKEYTDLLELITGITVGVENNEAQITWRIDQEYDNIASLNLLIFYANNFKDFKWNHKSETFVNKKLKIENIKRENLLLEQLKSKNDTVAINAFIKLTEVKPREIEILTGEINKSDFELNYIIPTFPLRFLTQLTHLTQYCKQNKIDYHGSSYVNELVGKLKSKLSFRERMLIEDELISRLTLDDITAFEYWCLIYEKNWDLTYSAGRVLDIFYSKQWKNIMSNPKQLAHYLKKSALFERLGIIGVSNDYLIKFKGCNEDVLKMLSGYKSKDSDIMSQAKLATEIQSRIYEHYPLSDMETITYHVDDFEDKLTAMLKDYNDSSEEMGILTNLLSKISYSQIGTALLGLEKINLKNSERVYSFLNRDFGFFLMGFDKGYDERKGFMELYNNKTEYELYSHYLNLAGIIYKNPDGSLNYDEIYDYIKYGETTAFVGGGGSTHDNGIYAVIKLLEITFDTSLGFSNKYCSSNNMYSCTSDEKVRTWMKYLQEKQLLIKKHDEPISFHTYKYSYKRWGRDY